MYSTYMSFHWESCVSCCKTWASIDFDSLDVSNLLFSFSTCVVQTPQHAPRMPSHPLNLLLSPASHNWSQEAGWADSRIRIFSFEPGIIVALDSLILAYGNWNSVYSLCILMFFFWECRDCRICQWDFMLNGLVLSIFYEKGMFLFVWCIDWLASWKRNSKNSTSMQCMKRMDAFT